MAYDKVVDSAALDGALTDIADAIREKTGSTEKLTLEGMATAIVNLPVGGGGASGIYMAQVTPAVDVFDLEIQHGLGTTDILLAACFVEKLDGEANSAMQAMAICRLFAKTEIPVRMTSTTQALNYEVFFPFNYNDGDYRSGSGGVPNAENLKSRAVDENTFLFARVGTNQKYHIGFTYTVIIIAASAFAPTEVQRC